MRCGLTALVFVHAEQTVNLGFDAARAGLAAVSADGWLKLASSDAYDAGLRGMPAGVSDTAESGTGEPESGGAPGITGLARVGPRGDVPMLSKLVRVHMMDVRSQGDSAMLALRWEATGYGGDLFPALDADITLSPVGDGTCLLAIDGAYRPPLGPVGAALDAMVLHRVATSTARSLLSRLAESLAAHAQQAG